MSPRRGQDLWELTHQDTVADEDTQSGELCGPHPFDSIIAFGEILCLFKIES